VQIAIVGGGPAGLYAAYYAGLRGMKPVVFESAARVGGKLSAVYPDKPIYDVPGFVKVPAQKLVDLLEEQANQFSVDWHLNESVLDLRRLDQNWQVSTSQGIYEFPVVILATGGGAYTPKPHPCETLMSYLAAGVGFQIPQDLFDHASKVVVVGGGDSALDWFFFLLKQGKNVFLIHRSQHFRAHQAHVQELLSQHAQRVFLDTQIVDALGQKNLEKIVLEDLEKTQQTLVCDQVLLCLGSLKKNFTFPSYPTFSQANHWMSLEDGLYGIGEGFDCAGKVNLIVTGFAEAAQAVNHACHWLSPKERIQPIYSTTLMKVRQRGAR
jgi:thioredoxin reductase (NADPH)